MDHIQPLLVDWVFWSSSALVGALIELVFARYDPQTVSDECAAN